MILNLNNEKDLQLFAKGTENLRVGITSGCYDLLHYMHLVYFTRCRRMCDVLVVGVDSDDLVHRAKGTKRPIIPEPQRVAMVDSLKPVDAAFVMGSLEDFEHAVAATGAKMIFKNGDFKEEEVVGREHAQVVIVPDVQFPNSTTGIISNIISKHVGTE